MFDIYITNLGKYNEGELVGKWIELPMEKEQFYEELESIGVDGVEYEEWFITDWEHWCGYKVHEYENFDRLNAIAEELEGVEDEDLFEAIYKAVEDMDKAKEIYDEHRYEIFKDKTEEQAYEQWACESGDYDAAGDFAWYVDWQKFYQDNSDNLQMCKIGPLKWLCLYD